MNTLNMLSQYTEISDRTVDRIISCCTPQEGNETVLEYLILDIKSNSDLVEFSDNIERIVGDDSTTLKSFRNGKICTCMNGILLCSCYIITNHNYVHTYILICMYIVYVCICKCIIYIHVYVHIRS